MIKVPLLQVFVKLDMSTTTVKSIPPHELPILQEKHHGQVTINKVTKHTKKVDPETEYKRLRKVHGIDNRGDDATNRPWVEVLYGRFVEGRFEKSMKQGAKHYLPKKKKKAKNEVLSPQQKAANTRAKNKAAKLAEDQNAQDPVPTQDAA